MAKEQKDIVTRLKALNEMIEDFLDNMDIAEADSDDKKKEEK